MILFLFLSLSYSISNIITQSKIFEGVRNFIGSVSSFFGDMFHCMMCIGFWVGMFLSFFLPISCLYIVGNNVWIGHFFDACIGSGIAWSFHCVIDYFALNNQISEQNIVMAEEIIDQSTTELLT